MRKLMVAFAFLLSSAAGATESLRLPVPELETLPNGLEVAWFLNDRLPVVDLALLVKSGSRDDPQGRSGTAELLSSCLDRGAGGLSARELAAAVERLGASRYISADEDTFSVGMHGLAPDAPVLLDILARLVVRPEFPEAEVAREHARLQDRWSHLADYSESLAGVAFRRLMTAGTSYGRGSFLSAAEFSKVGRAEIAAFHRRHFTPRNSILMVVGRVDRTEFRRRILDSFGEWKGEAPVRERKKYFDPRLPRSPAGKIVIVDRPGLTQAQVRLGLPAPLIQAPEHYALVVANAMLGEYFH
ncbi:MAG: insulinase family protein, partial [Oligoflexia bacterium]|nr:insulinase family protein [Oligoflexia bacterium]